MKSVFWCSQSSARRIASALATMSFRISVSSTSHDPSWSIQAPRLHQSPVSGHPVPMLLLSHQHNSELPTWPFPPLPLAYNARSVLWHPYLRSYGSFASITGSNEVQRLSSALPLANKVPSHDQSKDLKIHWWKRGISAVFRREN